MKPQLLDLFCGAGGAAMGYHRAGFGVVGVDIEPQPNYPFEFYRADVTEILDYGYRERYGYRTHGEEWSARDFDVIHASPPCQRYSTLAYRTGGEYPDLVARTRRQLKAVGRPYVIENVMGAPLVSPIRLCGSSFGLGVWRHRLFEISIPLTMVPECRHWDCPDPVDVTGTGGARMTPKKRTGGGVSRKPKTLGEARRVMGIDWMSRRELSQAIPPAYTEWIGRRLMESE